MRATLALLVVRFTVPLDTTDDEAGRALAAVGLPQVAERLRGMVQAQLARDKRTAGVEVEVRE